MVSMKVLIIAVLIAGAMCHPGKDGDDKDKKGKHHKHFEKMKKCWKETEELEECCPFPKDDEYKNDEDCKQHLEGVDDDDHKKKWHARTCFLECIFKKKGLLDDKGEIDKDKLKQGVEKYLDGKGEPEFKDISLESIDYCFDKFEEKKEEWKKWAEKHNKTGGPDGPKDKGPGGPGGDKGGKGGKGWGPKCNMAPAGLMGCMKQNVVRNCPESKWQSTDECEEKKANATPMDECFKHD